jgi:hypothetical protein
MCADSSASPLAVATRVSKRATETLLKNPPAVFSALHVGPVHIVCQNSDDVGWMPHIPRQRNFTSSPAEEDAEENI